MKRRARVSLAEIHLRQIVALGSSVRPSAWESAQATLAQRKAQIPEGHAAHLGAIARKGRA